MKHRELDFQMLVRVTMEYEVFKIAKSIVKTNPDITGEHFLINNDVLAEGNKCKKTVCKNYPICFWTEFLRNGTIITRHKN